LLRWEPRPEEGHGNETAVQPEFKREAVRLVKERGVTVVQVASDL
jgi:transposase-like protein